MIGYHDYWLPRHADQVIEQADMSDNGQLLEVRDLAVQFKTDEGIVKAVNGIAYELSAGGSLASWGSRAAARASARWPCCG